MTTRPAVRPIINHVAISVDAKVLDAAGRAALLDFYGEVFGWRRGTTAPRRAIRSSSTPGRCVSTSTSCPPPTISSGPPGSTISDWRSPRIDELTAILDRAKAYREKDDRVVIIDLDEMTTHGPTSDFTLTNAYISFLIPLQIELQHIAEVPAG